MIEAAGGAVWRVTSSGTLKVLLVHRPRYDDWSLPKGKAKRGEAALECALREVREETGMRCEAVAELPQTRYVDRKGREKRVRYWAMTTVSGRFRPNREVDEVRWVTTAEAGGVLTYPHDVVVVRALEARLSGIARRSA